MSLKNKIKSLFHSKSQNKYDLNNVELSLTNSIDDSDFVLLKNGTIKKKRKKNSYYEGYLDNKRLNKAMENSNKKRVKSFSNEIKEKNKLFKSFKSNNEINIKKIVHSDNNIFSKAQKINIFENVVINNINNDNLKLSYSYNKNSNKKEKKLCNCDKYNEKSKCKYSQMMDKKQKKLDKYENLIKTKNMYKDLYKNLKKKNLKKSIKNKNNSKKNKNDSFNEFIPDNKNYQKENVNLNIINTTSNNNNNLQIIKNDIIQYNPFYERKREKNRTVINKSENRNLKLNLNNLLVFKKQKDYKHFDNIGDNYNYYERNESERKKVKNNNISEYINILNKIKNEKNKSNIRNIYDKNYGNIPDIIDNDYGNHYVYTSTNINYNNYINKSRSNINHKLTNINMNKVSFKNIENITDTIKKNYSILNTNNFNNIKTYISNTNRNKEKEIGKIKNNKSNININNKSYNYFNKNYGRNILNKNLKKNKSYSNYNKYNILIDKSISIKDDFINKSQKKPLNNLKKYETKVIKTYFDYGNKLENYNNINRKEIKYCNTDKKNKLSNYNYYNSSQHIQNYNYNYNLRDRYKKEETKNEKINDYNYKNIIYYKKQEKNNININNKYGITKEIKQKNKITNYHSSRKNHNYYESKSVNANKMKINNQIINSYNKRNNNNNILITSLNIKNDIKKNLNEKFQNINTNNNNILINSTNNINQNKNRFNNIKVTSINNTNKLNKVNEELNNIKRILKIKPRKSHSYSPNKKIKKNYFIYGKNNKIILDMKLITNDSFNYSQSQSTKLLNKIKKEKNEIIKMNKLKKNLTEKNIVKIPFNNNKKNKKNNLIIKNKSFDSIMPPNQLDDIYKKNNKQ